MRPYAFALFVAVAVAVPAAAEEKEPEKKGTEEPAGDLELDFDLDSLPPTQPAPPAFDLDLDAPDVPAVPPPPVAAPEESLPPPPIVVEPAPLPVVTVKRIVPLPPPSPPSVPADPMPTPAPKAWGVAVGVLGSVGGMSALTPRGLSVSDAGSALVGGLLTAEFSRWEGRISVRRVFQDRWVAANVRSDHAWEGSLQAGRWLWSPLPRLSLGVLFGGSYRSHGAPSGVWWERHGPTPAEWRGEVVPSVVWRFPNQLDLVASVPFGYGSGSLDQREWRNFQGAFASVEFSLRYAVL